jgi:DNA-binding NtrC family response regulator
VRLVAATNKTLEQLVREGKFREDLYFRLNVVRITLPPLRDRPEDIPVLVEHLLGRINARDGRRVTKVTPEAMARLQAHPWPGNVRQLEHALMRAVVMAHGDVVSADLLVLETAPPVPVTPPVDAAPTRARDPLPDDPSLDAVEKAHVVRILAATGGHLGRACRLLGISRPTLARKMRRYALPLPANRTSND